MPSFRSFMLPLFAVILFSAPAAKAAAPIPITFHGGLVWVKIEVPGRAERLNFVLDSGAGASVIDAAAAQRLGLKLGSAELVHGVAGTASGHWISHFEGRVGIVPVPSRVLAMDLHSASVACHQQVDGLLGADFFRGRTVQLDYEAGVLRLLEREERARLSGEALPLSLRGDALCTRVSVGNSSPAWMRVDTGCDSALRWVAGSARTAKAARSPSIALALQPTHYQLTEVQLGHLKLHAVKAGIHQQQIFPGEAGLIGNGLLSKFVVTFDVPGKKLWLQPR